MAAADLIIISLGAILAALYFLRGTLFGIKSPTDKLAGDVGFDAGAGDENASDFVSKLEKQVRCTRARPVTPGPEYMRRSGPDIPSTCLALPLPLPEQAYRHLLWLPDW